MSDDVIMSLNKGVKAYASELGFHEINLEESRDWHIINLCNVKLKLKESGKHVSGELKMEGSSKILFRRFKKRDAKGIRSIYPQFFEDCPHLKSEEGFCCRDE